MGVILFFIVFLLVFVYFIHVYENIEKKWLVVIDLIQRKQNQTKTNQKNSQKPKLMKDGMAILRRQWRHFHQQILVMSFSYISLGNPDVLKQKVIFPEKGRQAISWLPYRPTSYNIGKSLFTFFYKLNEKINPST